MPPTLSSPKLGAREALASAFPYYAGFSPQFVSDVLQLWALPATSLVVDPWSGAGTTSLVAVRSGLSAWGGDLNPVMNIVAKARMLGASIAPSEISLCDSIIRTARKHQPNLKESDPLLRWFAPSSVISLRAIEHGLRLHLVPSNSAAPTDKESISSVAAFYYVALFRTVRKFCARFRASNPTWMKSPGSLASRLRPSPAAINREFRESVLVLRSRLAAESASVRSNPTIDVEGVLTRSTLVVSDATSLPLASRSANAALTSPPYCTRIDYVVATALELAVLGVDAYEDAQLRRSMLGTSVVAGAEQHVELAWGPSCADFLRALERHSSKASAGYYLKSHLRYFDGLNRSLLELDRVLVPRSHVAIVVQDSHYKDLHNPLPLIVQEMADGLGWETRARHDFSSLRHIGRVNSRSRRWRTASTATESVLLFQTAA